MSALTGEEPLIAVASSPYRCLDVFQTGSWRHLGRAAEMVAEPHEIAADEARRLLYVTHTYREGGYQSDVEKGHEVSVVAVDEPQVVDVIDIGPYMSPHDIEYSPVHDMIYVSVERNGAGNGLVMIDAAERSVVGHIAVEPPNSHWLGVLPDGTKAYVTHKEGPVISVIDLHARRVAATIDLPGGGEEVDISPDGRFAFVVTPQQTPPADAGPSASVLKIDTATDQIVGELELEPTVVAVRAAGADTLLVSQMYPGGNEVIERMYAGDGGLPPGTLYVIDVETMQLRSQVTLDTMSFTIRASDDGRTGYVANIGAGTLSVVDLAAGEVTRTVECTTGGSFGGTHGLALMPYRP